MIWADDNVIVSFKGRELDKDKPIQVYRNLNRSGKWYSIRQSRIVVAHTTAICIHNPEFIVKESAKARAIRTQTRNVHAYIQGMCTGSGMGTTANSNDLPAKIQYKPFSNLKFYCDNLTSKPFEVKSAMFCIVNENGISAAYVNKS